jgi:membrane-associated phospholipid phosphatase
MTGRRGGAPRSRWPLLAYVPVAVWAARKRRDKGLPQAFSLAVAYGAPLAVAAGLPRGRPRAAAMWAAHMWAYKIAFEIPYDRPAELRERLDVDTPIRVDRRLGGGQPPGERLQRRWRDPPRLSALDRVMTFVYALWEAEPHLALAWILLNDRDRFPLAALRLGATFDATLLGYALRPTAPPWWASEREGRMGRAVRRVTLEVFKELRGQPRPGTDHNSDANPWAAFPSDHFASAAMAAAVLTQSSRTGGAAAAVYAVMLGAALVYTGEHYVSDLVAGAALAAGIYFAAPAALPMAQRFAGAIAAR